MPNDKLVQLPSGETVQFPSSMADADINGAIQQYLVTKAKGPATTSESTLTQVGRGAALGAASGLGIPETQTPIQDLFKNAMNSFATMMGSGAWTGEKSATDVLKANPAVSIPTGLAEGFGKATDAINPMLDNFFRMLSNRTGGRQLNYKSIDSEQTAHDITSFGTQLATLKGGKEAAEGGVGGGSVRNAAREVMGEGASKSRLLADQHAHALATRDHLSTVADAVHTDAQAAMSNILSKVDEAHPEGAFSKADIQGKVKSAVGDLVQVPEKMPPSVAKILKEEKPTWENLAIQKDVSGFVNRLKSGGFGDAEIRETLRNQGYSEREIGGMTGGGAAVDSLTAEQLKQMRSDVGQELGRYSEKGTVGAALKKVYGTLSQELRGAAANAGVEREWLEANNKYSQYAKDFQRGPLKRVLGGGTASGIMEPLTGTTRQQLIDTLQKYKDAGFNVNMDALQDEMRRYGMSKTVNRLSQPSKWDLLMAGFSPKMLAIRQLGPRLMRNPKAIDRFAGKGFDTPISPRQVYPTKAAAMKARGESDTEMDIRRGASGPAQSMSEDIRDAEARTASEAEAKRQAWERRKKE